MNSLNNDDIYFRDLARQCLMKKFLGNMDTK